MTSGDGRLCTSYKEYANASNTESVCIWRRPLHLSHSTEPRAMSFQSKARTHSSRRNYSALCVNINATLLIALLTDGQARAESARMLVEGKLQGGPARARAWTIWSSTDSPANSIEMGWSPPYLAGDVECWTCSDGLAVGAESSRCALRAHLPLACAHIHRASIICATQCQQPGDCGLLGCSWTRHLVCNCNT